MACTYQLYKLFFSMVPIKTCLLEFERTAFCHKERRGTVLASVIFFSGFADDVNNVTTFIDGQGHVFCAEFEQGARCSIGT